MHPAPQKYTETMSEVPNSVCVAESLTGGLVADAFVQKSGASNYFRGGVIAYTLRVKVDILGVDETEAEQTNCVSAEVARQMAKGASTLFDANFAIATTGYAESFADNGQTFAQQAYIALYDRQKNVYKEKYVTADDEDMKLDRNQFRKLVVREASFMYVNYITECNSSIIVK